MIKQVIQEMVDRGWSYYSISLRTGISAYRLRDGKIGPREEAELMRVASTEAGIEIDDLEDDE